MKAVLDSPVLVAALLHPTGATAQLFQLASQGRFDICLSDPILEEATAALFRDADRLDRTREDVVAFMALLVTVARVVRDVPDLPGDRRDLEHGHAVAAALAARADVIVTGDEDLLALGRYREVDILSVGDFLNRVS